MSVKHEFVRELNQKNCLLVSTLLHDRHPQRLAAIVTCDLSIVLTAITPADRARAPSSSPNFFCSIPSTRTKVQSSSERIVYYIEHAYSSLASLSPLVVAECQCPT